MLAILAGCVLAGCGGGGGGESQAVVGSGFRFDAPAGWTVGRGALRVWALRGKELVQVTTFPLQRPYRAALFTRVATELSSRMKTLARQSGGRVTADSVVTAGGVRSHTYRVENGGHVDEYTFVLRGRREYLLVCRRSASHSDAACRRLISSFALTRGTAR